MNIRTIYNIHDAKEAIGITVVIDVFRAFSTACEIIEADVKRLLVAEHVQEVYQLKDDNPEFVLIGERNGTKLPGFDHHNSPTEIKKLDLHGKIVVLTTSSGTRKMLQAKNADEVITGAFVNVHAIISYIQSQNPKNVSLICTGTHNEHIKDEDALCAKYIEESLNGLSPDFEDIRKKLRTSMHARHFFDDSFISHPEEDFDACMDIDSCDFVLRAQPYDENVLELVKI